MPHRLATRVLRALRPAVCLAALAALGGAGVAQAAPTAADKAFYQRAAACVAVLEKEAGDMAGRYQAGERTLKPALVKLTEQGFAFIGQAYLRGLRQAEADRMLDEAKAAQRSLPADARAQLVAACRSEGARLYADANGLEQALVSNRARARVDKLLAKRRPPAGTSPATAAASAP
ncbi:hypothetical protein [Ideonella sp.]|uniref:hypothetical protein n=1 Tax=Ideonella sp. TaxID=1929293 RepID=UPI0035B488EE